MMSNFTHHGGNIMQAAQAYGRDAGEWLDLSTGINPAAWPYAGSLAYDWRALPALDDLAMLEAVAARHFGVSADLCCAVPGSELALRLLGLVVDMSAAYLAPSYRTHAAIFRDSKPILALEAPTQHALALLLANPNNPDGRIIGINRLAQWHDWLAKAGGWLIVDEAFADACPEQSMVAQVDSASRLIVLRSFGKFFGLAGVRLGFVIAPPTIIAAIRQLLGDWPLSVAALKIGIAAYQDLGWIMQARLDLLQRATRLDELLCKYGLQPVGACPHFRLINTPRANAIFETLARRGVLTRPFDYDRHWLRFGVPAGDSHFNRLDIALANG